MREPVYLTLSKKIQILFLSLIIALFYSLFLFKNVFASEVEITFFVNSVLLLFCFITATVQQSISIFWLHSFFMLVFLNIIPGIQWQTHLFFYFRNGAENLRSLVFEANILIFIWNLLFINFYNFFQKRYSFRFRIKPRVSSQKITFLGLLLAGLIIALIISLGVSFLIFRYTVFDEVGGKSSSPLLILYIYFIKPVSFFLAVLVFITIKKKWPLKIFLILVGVMLNFPLAVARFYLLAMILAIYTVFFAYKYRRAWFLLVICIFGFFFSFILTRLRFWSPTAGLHDVLYTKSISIIGGMDTDSFETLCLTLRYIGEHGIMWGYNILACIFFFVPRGIWPGKPQATNAVVVDAGTIHKADAILKDYTTISCPIVAESYISFGIGGTILFALIISFLAAVLDKYFKSTVNSKFLDHKIFRLYYGGLVGMLFLVFRGSLMAGYSYATGYTLAFFFTLVMIGISFRFTVKRGRAR